VRARVAQAAFVLAQLALLALVIRQFQIESAAFVRIAMLAFAGFVVHACLPLRWRLPFFVLLSLAAIGVVLGVQEGAWLVALGVSLIAICHLPVSFAARVALLLITGATLAALRVEWMQAPWSRAIWPILGSMFMFRLVVYLYDLKHDTAPVSVWRTLAYFFLLPNICFPLFPVVDYKTFRRTYFDEDPYRIYQTGIDWMARGVTHLVLYRFVYYYLTLPASEVHGPVSFAQYVLANFLLYLRVSGQFHLIVGMLYLFGFRLPETHHRYYFSSSFTDFWRRINIYWKDFMLKVFFNPLYFKLRGLGPTYALVIATLVVFLATWALHAYQWFWLRGSFLLVWTDVAFWSILAVLVVVNGLHELRHGRARRLARTAWTLRRGTSTALRTVGTFVAICLLWSLWTSESFAAWFALWGALAEPRTAGGDSPGGGLLTLLVIAVGVVAAGAPPGRVESTPARSLPAWARVPWATATTVVSLVALALLGIQTVYTQLGPDAATFVNSLRSGQLSRVDTALLERGYYEDLVRVDRFNSQLWEVYMNKPHNWLDVQGLGLERFTGDFLEKELVPSMSVQTRFGTIRTNRWGMRDRDYERQPSPGTYRFAMLGASTVMGWGVADDEVFEAQVERRLSQERATGPYTGYEILNFAVPGYEPLQQVAVLGKVWGFSPDALLYVVVGRELHAGAQNLVGAVRKKLPVPDSFLRDLAQRAGIDADTDETTALRRLAPFRGEIISWVYGAIVRASREHRVVPVFVLLPHIYSGVWEEEAGEILHRAREAGFLVLDLRDIFGNVDGASLRLAEWDAHPNVKGHQIMAANLYEAITRNADVIFVPREARQ
jgi:hypothetical protein